ncbi:MAG: M56 family metallopeptidase [Alphaproteobacteria bacterium]|nr:M56 family metallopeptidase [Alphaproteobacteria bacterium]
MSIVVDASAVALGVIADAGLKATVVLAAAALAARALQPASASARHALWACALASLPAVAGLSWASRGSGLALSLSPAACWTALGIWAVGVLAVLAPLGRGIFLLLRARHAGRVEGDVVWTDAVDVPLTFAGTVLMPAAALAWDPADRRAALLHERAHRARGDWWVHVGAWGVCALFWFHPLCWWGRRALALEAERAADDRVLAAGVVPSTYARQLLSLARGPAAGLALGASVTALRVRAILGPARRGARRWPAVLAAGVLAIASLPTLSAWAAWAPPPPSEGCLPLELLP